MIGIIHIWDFFGLNCLQIVLTISTWILLTKDRTIDARTRHIFSMLILLNFIQLTAEYVDAEIRYGIIPAEETEFWLRLRTVTTTVSYITKTILPLLLVLGILRPTRKPIIGLCCLAAVNILIALSGLFGPWMFWIDEENVYQSGVLKPVYMGIIYFFFVLLLGFVILNWRKRSALERIAVLIMIVLNVFASAIGLADLYRFNLLSLAINVTLLIYFLFCFTEKTNELLAIQSAQLEKQRADFLLSQIQPHFVYNTLSIACSLCRENPELAEKTLVDFSYYLRDNLDLGGDVDALIPIERELEHTKLYTGIEQLRFPRLTVRYIVEDGGYAVPFLCVQPMVENAVRHGVRGQADGCVTVALTEDTVGGAPVHKIEISDNGTGKSLSASSLTPRSGIGISNVTDRVAALTGGSVEVKFTPQGTTAVILIPYRHPDAPAAHTHTHTHTGRRRLRGI